MPKTKRAPRLKYADQCGTEECLKVAVITGLCQNCYASYWYWLRTGKTPKDLRERQKSLRLFSSRMNALVGVASAPAKGTVVLGPWKKKKRR